MPGDNYLVATPQMDSVRQLETTDVALAGPGGVLNTQAQSLLNRTEYLAGFADRNNTYTKAQRGAYVDLTSAAASIAVDLESSNNFSHTMTEDTTLAAPTNAIAGQSGVIHFTQHASAAKTLAFNAFWQFGLADTHTLTTTAGGTAVMTYIVDPAGTSATCSWMNKS